MATSYDFKANIAKVITALGEPIPFDYSQVCTGAATENRNFGPGPDKIWIVTSIISYHNDVAARKIEFYRLRGGSDSLLFSNTIAAGVYVPLLEKLGLPFLICTASSYIKLIEYAIDNAKTWWVQGDYFELDSINDLLTWGN